MTIPQLTIRIQIHHEGRMSFKTILEGTSKMAYGKKNTWRKSADPTLKIKATYRQCDVVLRTSEFEIFHHTSNLCISYVATVQECQDV